MHEQETHSGGTMHDIFLKIINGEVPAKIRFQDALVTAFDDISPSAPIHILIVPNKQIAHVESVEPGDEAMLGHMFTAAKQIAKDLGLSEKGYRLIINNGSDGGQEINHLHMHLLGGEPIGPMRAKKQST
jgi:histidine triad (HIT) family protein